MLENLKPVPVKTKCKIGRFQDELEPSDQKLLQGYLDDPDFSTEALVRALSERKLVEVSSNVVGAHRKQLCACAKLK